MNDLSEQKLSPLVSDVSSPVLQVNAQGQVIFDETSLGMLDEYIHKVVREELDRVAREIRMQTRSIL